MVANSTKLRSLQPEPSYVTVFCYLLEEEFIILVLTFRVHPRDELFRVSYDGRFLSASTHMEAFVCTRGRKALPMGWRQG